MRWMAVGLVAIAAFVAPSAAAQSDCQASFPGLPLPDGYIGSDDNSFETNYGWSESATVGEFVMRLSPPSGSHRLRSVCVCFLHDNDEPGDDQVTFSLNIYDDSAGSPGPLLATVSNQTALSLLGFRGWKRVELPVSLIVDGPFFAGPRWNPSVDKRFFVCGDQSGPPNEPAFGRATSGGAWGALGPNTSVPSYRALGVRAIADPVAGPAGDCIRNASTACLLNGRFEVKVSMKNFANPPVTFPGIVQLYSGQSSETEQSVSFYSFNNGNVEVFVKMVNACPTAAPAFWLFAAGATNAETTITVRDTVSEEVRTIFNPSGQLFETVANTQAFLTCDE